MIRSSITPSDLIVERLANSKMLGVSLITFFSCRSGSMTISNGCETKQLTLYPHATPMINNDDFVWLDYDDNATQRILTIGQALNLKDTTEDEVIINFISEPSSVTFETYNQLTAILESETQKSLNMKIYLKHQLLSPLKA